MSDLGDEVEFDLAMLEHGVPIELIGRSGTLIIGPDDGDPEAELGQ